MKPTKQCRNCISRLMEYKRARSFSRNCGELRFNINSVYLVHLTCLRTCYDAQALRHATSLHATAIQDSKVRHGLPGHGARTQKVPQLHAAEDSHSRCTDDARFACGAEGFPRLMRPVHQTNDVTKHRSTLRR